MTASASVVVVEPSGRPILLVGPPRVVAGDITLLNPGETTRRADRVISSARCAVDLLQQNPKPTRAQIDAQHKWYDRSQSAP